MANFDDNSLRILEQIEDEFRNQYWIIRNICGRAKRGDFATQTEK